MFTFGSGGSGQLGHNHLEMNIIRGWLLNCGDLKCQRSHVGGKDCS